MADEIDIAQEFMPDQNEVVMQTISQQLELKRSIPSQLVCSDCEADIPDARRKSGGITCCVECQEFRDRFPHITFSSTGKVVKNVCSEV